MIHGPLYISLDHRSDRRALFEKECSMLDIVPKRVTAIYMPDNGALGCLMSHIEALNSAPFNMPVWICEDDCKFLVNREELDSVIGEFLNSDADILCLAYASRNDYEFSNLLKRSMDLQTASCYIVKPTFRKKLLDLWNTVLKSLQAKIEHPRKLEYSKLPVVKGNFETTDQSWKLLQQSHVFVIPKTRCALQRESFSDIENKNARYNV